MCDYSMQHVASRPAKVGDVLVTTRFAEGLTGGFSAVGQGPRIEQGVGSCEAARGTAGGGGWARPVF